VIVWDVSRRQLCQDCFVTHHRHAHELTLQAADTGLLLMYAEAGQILNECTRVTDDWVRRVFTRSKVWPTGEEYTKQLELVAELTLRNLRTSRGLQ